MFKKEKSLNTKLSLPWRKRRRSFAMVSKQKNVTFISLLSEFLKLIVNDFIDTRS